MSTERRPAFCTRQRSGPRLPEHDNRKGDPMPPLTPSEIVLVRGERFADAKRPIALLPGRTTLLDGSACVRSKQLVTTMLAAALLAQQQAGSIRLEIQDAADQAGDAAASLMVVPTGR